MELLKENGPALVAAGVSSAPTMRNLIMLKMARTLQCRCANRAFGHAEINAAVFPPRTVWVTGPVNPLREDGTLPAIVEADERPGGRRWTSS